MIYKIKKLNISKLPILSIINHKVIKHIRTYIVTNFEIKNLISAQIFINDD
jgi:hypothetical protein